MHPSYTKIHAIFSKCDNVIENIQIFMSLQLFFGVKICTNMKNKMEREYSIVISIFKKK